MTRCTRQALGWTAAAAGVAAGGYAALVASAWMAYGRPAAPRPDERDSLLDEILPEYEVVERHRVDVAAPAAVTLAVARSLDMRTSPIVRAIFDTRARVLGADRSVTRRPRGLMDEIQALGWRVVAEVPDREVVAAAVTQPWFGDVIFRGLDRDAFKAFDEPGYVKIAWTLRADPVTAQTSVFRSETRVATTDPAARRRFRWYWARFSPGIWVIRRIMAWEVARLAARGSYRSHGDDLHTEVTGVRRHGGSASQGRASR